MAVPIAQWHQKGPVSDVSRGNCVWSTLVDKKTSNPEFIFRGQNAGLLRNGYSVWVKEPHCVIFHPDLFRYWAAQRERMKLLTVWSQVPIKIAIR